MVNSCTMERNREAEKSWREGSRPLFTIRPCSMIDDFHRERISHFLRRSNSWCLSCTALDPEFALGFRLADFFVRPRDFFDVVDDDDVDEEWSPFVGALEPNFLRKMSFFRKNSAPEVGVPPPPPFFDFLRNLRFRSRILATSLRSRPNSPSPSLSSSGALEPSAPGLEEDFDWYRIPSSVRKRTPSGSEN